MNFTRTLELHSLLLHLLEEKGDIRYADRDKT